MYEHIRKRPFSYVRMKWSKQYNILRRQLVALYFKGRAQWSIRTFENRGLY